MASSSRDGDMVVMVVGGLVGALIGLVGAVCAVYLVMARMEAAGADVGEGPGVVLSVVLLGAAGGVAAAHGGALAGAWIALRARGAPEIGATMRRAALALIPLGAAAAWVMLVTPVAIFAAFYLPVSVALLLVELGVVLAVSRTRALAPAPWDAGRS